MNIPSLPESFYRIIFLVAIVGIGFSAIKIEEYSRIENDYVDQYNSLIDSTILIKMKKIAAKDVLIENSRGLTKRYNLPNPISVNDSIASFNRTVAGDSKELMVHDSLDKMFDQYRGLDLEYILSENFIESRKKAVDARITSTNEDRSTFRTIGIIAIFLLAISLIGLYKQHIIDDAIKQRELNKSQHWYPRCQSCGRSFIAGIRNGKEKDGNVNTGFCSDCYDNGKYTFETNNVDEFIEQSQANRLNTFSKRKKKEIIAEIKKLERWRSPYNF